tara:strand:+ start:982 stop:1167 length:186 start_codon:yes stop_codon:yes gene_type:complete
MEKEKRKLYMKQYYLDNKKYLQAYGKKYIKNKIIEDTIKLKVTLISINPDVIELKKKWFTI